MCEARRVTIEMLQVKRYFTPPPVLVQPLNTESVRGTAGIRQEMLLHVFEPSAAAPVGRSDQQEMAMTTVTVDIDEARRDLAAIFRWTAREGMHEGIANHFSYAVSDDGQLFLMNPSASIFRS